MRLFSEIMRIYKPSIHNNDFHTTNNIPANITYPAYNSMPYFNNDALVMNKDVGRPQPVVSPGFFTRANYNEVNSYYKNKVKSFLYKQI